MYSVCNDQGGITGGGYSISVVLPISMTTKSVCATNYSVETKIGAKKEADGTITIVSDGSGSKYWLAFGC